MNICLETLQSFHRMGFEHIAASFWSACSHPLFGAGFEFRVSGFGFQMSDFGFWASGLGVSNLGFGVQGISFRFWGLRLTVEGMGSRVRCTAASLVRGSISKFGLRASGFGCMVQASLFKVDRCRKNTAHIRQSRPWLSKQVLGNVLKLFHLGLNVEWGNH